MSDIRIVFREYRDDAEISIRQDLGQILTELHLLENAPEQCAKNVRNAQDGRRAEPRLKTIAHWSKYYSAPPHAIVHPAWRPPEALALFGVFKVWHDRGLAIVYSSCSAAWLYIALRGGQPLCSRFDTAFEVATPLLCLALWLGLLYQYKRWDTATDEEEELTPLARSLLRHSPNGLGLLEREKIELAEGEKGS